MAQELKRFLQNGGSVLIFPGKEIDFRSYRDFLTSAGCNFYESLDTVNTKVDWLNYDHEIYRDVFEKKQENIDLPAVMSHYRLSRLTRSAEEQLMKMQNGDIFLSGQSSGKGKIYLCALPLSARWSNFSRHSAFVWSLYKIAVFSHRAGKLFYTLGRDETIEAKSSFASGENVYHITGENHFDIIPEHSVSGSSADIFIHGQVTRAGNYLLMAGKEPVSGISFNYDRKESDLSSLSAAELALAIDRNLLKNFSLIDTEKNDVTVVLAEISQGKKLWKLCVIFVLVFLALEIILLRFWK
jgi:hypothetical protein